MLCKFTLRGPFKCSLCSKTNYISSILKSEIPSQVEDRKYFSRSRPRRTESSPVTREAKPHSSSNELSLLNFKADLEARIPLKIKRDPFLKNLFQGKFDKDVLAFPEIINNKEIESLQKMSSSVSNYISANVDSAKVDSDCTFPVNALSDFKKMGLFGSRVPKAYGGLDMTAVEHIRLMEACSLDSSLTVILNTHNSIAAETLLLSSSDHLKNKYLPKIVSGEMVAALALAEIGLQCGTDISAINTVANRTKERTHYHLNGKKISVINGAAADVFLVLAKNLDPENSDTDEINYVAFLVEKDFPGVKIVKTSNELGIRGSNSCSIEFHETPVPIENVVGDPKKGYEVIYRNILMNRFHFGAFASGLSKALVDLCIDHGIHKFQYQKQVMEFEGVKDRIGRIMATTYAMESMTYLSAALFDSTEDPDLELENSAVKVFCTEGLWYCANEAFKIIGKEAYICGHPIERTIRDALACWTIQGNNDLIRQFITLRGIDHVANIIKYDVQKLRNPFYFPKYTIKNLYKQWKHDKNDLKPILDLEGYIHPNFQADAHLLEFAIQKFNNALEISLRYHGREIINHEVSLWRLANIVIEMYAMTAVISRASRSYCIGLPCANIEMSLAKAYCKDAYDRVEKLHRDFSLVEHQTSYLDLQQIAKESFRKEGYCVTPPFTRNY